MFENLICHPGRYMVLFFLLVMSVNSKTVAGTVLLLNPTEGTAADSRDSSTLFLQLIHCDSNFNCCFESQLHLPSWVFSFCFLVLDDLWRQDIRCSKTYALRTTVIFSSWTPWATVSVLKEHIKLECITVTTFIDITSVSAVTIERLVTVRWLHHFWFCHFSWEKHNHVLLLNLILMFFPEILFTKALTKGLSINALESSSEHVHGLTHGPDRQKNLYTALLRRKIIPTLLYHFALIFWWKTDCFWLHLKLSTERSWVFYKKQVDRNFTIVRN